MYNIVSVNMYVHVTMYADSGHIQVSLLDWIFFKRKKKKKVLNLLQLRKVLLT